MNQPTSLPDPEPQGSPVSSADPASDLNRGAETPKPAPSEAIGKKVGTGVSLNISLTVFLRGISFASQFVLAYFLTAADFGLNTTAVTIAILAGVFRDLGLAEWIVQKGARHYHETISSIFWLCLTINCALGVVVAALAPLIAWKMDEPQLLWMTLCVAASFPLGTLGTTLAARLRIELRFKEVLWMTGGSAILRYIGSMAFAWMGFGALSFVLPLPLFALYESAIMLALVRQPIWKGGARPALWAGIARASKWNLIGTASMALLNVGDYALLSGRMDKGQLGLYFFAYQLVAMTGAILANNVGMVMYPAIARLKDEPERMRAAAGRSARAIMLLSAPASVGVGVIMQPTEALVWNGRWATAVVPVLIFAALYPIRACMSASQAVLMGAGRFKRNALLNMAVGVALMVCAFVCTMPEVYQWEPIARWTMAAADDGEATPSAVGVAATIGVVRALACIVAIGISLATIQLGWLRMLRLMLPSWIISVAIGGGCLWADHHVLAAWHPAARIFLLGTGFGLGFVLAMRCLSPGTMADALSILPTRVSLLATRLLLLRS